MKEVKLPNNTLEFIEKLGIKGRCFLRSATEQHVGPILGKWRMVLGGAYTALVSLEESEFYLYVVVSDPTSGWRTPREELWIDEIVKTSICGSLDYAKAFETLKAAKTWVAAREILDGAQPGTMTVDGPSFDVDTLEGGPWLFSKLVKIWGLDKFTPHLPETANVYRDLDAAARYLKSRFIFSRLKLGDEELLAYRDRGAVLLSMRLIKPSDQQSGWNYFNQPENLPWLDRLFELHPLLIPRLLKESEESFSLIACRQHSEFASTGGNISLGSAEYGAKSTSEVLPRDETALVDIISLRPSLGVRPVLVDLLKPIGHRIPGGGFLGKAIAVMEYGDPGSCSAYTSRGGALLFQVPKDQKANFLIWAQRDGAGEGSTALLGVAVQNVGGIEYSTFTPNVEFHKLNSIWLSNGSRLQQAYLELTADLVLTARSAAV